MPEFIVHTTEQACGLRCWSIAGEAETLQAAREVAKQVLADNPQLFISISSRLGGSWDYPEQGARHA